MNEFFKMNQKLIIYSSIIFFILPLFGVKSLLSLFGNILILLFLIPILIFIILFLGLNSVKTKITQCQNCGNGVIGFQEECPFCGSKLNLNTQNQTYSTNASEETIEIEAEEVK